MGIATSLGFGPGTNWPSVTIGTSAGASWRMGVICLAGSADLVAPLISRHPRSGGHAPRTPSG